MFLASEHAIAGGVQLPQHPPAGAQHRCLLMRIAKPEKPENPFRDHQISSKLNLCENTCIHRQCVNNEIHDVTGKICYDKT